MVIGIQKSHLKYMTNRSILVRSRINSVRVIRGFNEKLFSNRGAYGIGSELLAIFDVWGQRSKALLEYMSTDFALSFHCGNTGRKGHVWE